MSSRGSTPALLALALGYFTLGTTSLAVVGLSAPMGDGLDVAPARIGLQVTVFALTFAIVAPLAPMALGRMGRKQVLLLGMALLTAGTVAAALAPNYAFLTGARVVAALGAAIFGPASSAAGSLIVPEERRQQALAVVFGGMTAASVLGVPLASFLGDVLGWRQALIGVAVLSGVALVGVAVLMPGLDPGPRPTPAAYRGVLATPGALPAVGTTLLFMAAQFTVYGIAGAYVADRFEASSGYVTATLLAFGIVGVLGNGFASRATRAIGTTRTVSLTVAGVAVAFAALLVVPDAAIGGLLLFALWAFFSQLYQAPQQARLVELLPEQRGLLLALNASALYLGMSLGSFIGSTGLPAWGSGILPAAGLGLLLLAGATHCLSVRKAETAPRPVPVSS